MLRRLYHEQPASFEFTPANLAWAEGQIAKYPEGRQASAVIPLLWRAQEQTGWLTKPALETVADMLGMPYIRVLEVATFYFMFQLAPVGSVAHIQVCGTTTCMICGSGDIISVCKEKISPTPHTVSADGKFSWEEVECLGACANAPMAQIGKDYYEDLTAETFSKLLDDMAAGNVPLPGSQIGRFSSEPAGDLVSLAEYKGTGAQYNGSVQRAVDIGDTIKRIDGTEVPLLTPWISKGGSKPTPPKPAAPAKSAVQQAAEAKKAAPKAAPKAVAPKVDAAAADAPAQKKPRTMKAPRKAGADDLKMLKGVGPKLEETLNAMGFWHFDQIAKWTAEEIGWVDENLKFKGRIARDGWVDQAKILAAGGSTEFSKRAKYD
ncbi:NADH-quinone oxidoreductase subunit E [Celeribacter baekdonensis]|uniref:NADH-quinone oxidoreductase subunit E n=1 Tax=Celeribacter baekdonensis TaxID=875171 RepID=A0A2R4M3B0_9RHOB|nr:NADH-quinone oxidoreductase subunit E [Celeribacter baekdonensis]AVW91618.1 NADH-quinone oxidoreductase subunit E [Celeribacter baekdonensis]|tara:strand:- start:60752 stop:61882 length:1131 start_codon:yes stop_codon:yes gene_type:complete